MTNIAAIHLMLANKQVGAPVLSASVLIFGGTKARADYVVNNWRGRLEQYGDDFEKSTESHIHFLLNSGAEMIEPDMLTSRVMGFTTLHQVAGTIWQNNYETHISHYAYLKVLEGQKKSFLPNGHQLDGYTLNAANRFVAEYERPVPTEANSPEAGLFYLKELYIKAKRLLGHDIDSDGAKILKERAPSVAAAVHSPLPVLPPLPVSNNSLTVPPLPDNLPPLPKF